MPKPLIAILFILGLVLGVILPTLGYSGNIGSVNTAMQQLQHDQDKLLADQASDPSDTQLISYDNTVIGYDEDTLAEAEHNLIFGVVGSLLLGFAPSIIAWIGALVNLAQLQQWTWFVLLLLFSGVMLVIYLIAGPTRPRSTAATVAAGVAVPNQPAYLPAVSPHPFGTPVPPVLPTPSPHMTPDGMAGDHYGQPDSALEVLKQRYARGEIDAATFDEMRERLDPPTR